MKRNRFISLSLTLVLAVGCSMPGIVNAATDTSGNSKETVTPQEVSEASTQNVSVDASVASEFSVSVPKTIQLDGSKKSANYKITCNGDFPADKKVTVTPDGSFILSSANKADETATVSQDKTEWRYDDNAEGTGTITAEGLSAGEWNGSFNFNIVFADAHEHDFNIPVYKTIHHDEVGHWEEKQVLVKDAWDEEVTEWVYVCNGCGMKFSPTEYETDVAALEALDDHQWESTDTNCQGYHSEKVVVDTIHHETEYETEKKWIIDTAAFDEEVVDYYECECGERQ